MHCLQTWYIYVSGPVPTYTDAVYGDIIDNFITVLTLALDLYKFNYMYLFKVFQLIL